MILDLPYRNIFYLTINRKLILSGLSIKYYKVHRSVQPASQRESSEYFRSQVIVLDQFLGVSRLL